MGLNYKVAKTGFNELDGEELRESFTSMSEVSFGSAYKVSEESVLSFNVGAAQTDHLSYPEEGVVQVDAIWLPKISASFENVWFHLGRFGVGSGLGAAIFLPSVESTTDGLSEEAKLFTEYELGHHWVIGLEVEAGYQRQTFINETHSLRSLGTSLGIGLHL